jgi:hypothetical protein
MQTEIQTRSPGKIVKYQFSFMCLNLYGEASNNQRITIELILSLDYSIQV